MLSAVLLGWGAALAAPCPALTVEATDTPYDASRTWLHEPGWFVPLDDPKTVPAAGLSYDAEEPMLSVTRGSATRLYPVGAMAYHHVSNDVIGGEPVVVTY